MGRTERTLSADSSAPAIARDLVEEFVSAAADHGVNGEMLARAKLAVSELVTNAVIHGSDPGKHLVVTLRYEGHTLFVDVVDRGQTLHPPPSDAGGYGLVIVERVADSFAIERGETWRATAEFRPRRAGDA